MSPLSVLSQSTRQPARQTKEEEEEEEDALLTMLRDQERSWREADGEEENEEAREDTC